MLVDWLAERTQLVGAVWLDPARWRGSWKGRIDFVRKRIRRYGVRKTVDEIAFFLYYQTLHAAREVRELEQHVISPWRARSGAPRWSGDTLAVSDINSPEAISFLRERRPDVAFAMCVKNYFGSEVRRIMKHGVFLWHDGFTPEYRGLYSPFWTVHNLDFERLGYTLLRMNGEYDAGEVFVQERAHGIRPRHQFHEYLGHKAIADGLPAVERFLKELEAGTASPIERPGARSAYYTYPGLSDFLRQRIRLRRLHETRASSSLDV